MSGRDADNVRKLLGYFSLATGAITALLVAAACLYPSAQDYRLCRAEGRSLVICLSIAH
jgi:hypothetical protein